MIPICLLLSLVAEVPADGLPAAPVTALAFAPDGNSVVVATPHEVVELAWPDLALRRKIAAGIDHVHDLSFSPDGKSLAIAGGKPGDGGRVVLVNWPRGTQERVIDAGADAIYCAAWYADGRKLALACGDKKVHLVSADVEASRSLEEHSAAVLAAVAMPRESDWLLLTAGRDQTIRLWSAKAPEKSLRSLDNHTAAVVDLSLRPAAGDAVPIVASAGADRTVRFWQPTIGRMLRFSRLPSPPLAICWTADGQHVCAACQDGRVRVVALQTARVVTEHTAISGWAYSIALAPGGKSLLVGGERGQLKIVPLDP